MFLALLDDELHHVCQNGQVNSPRQSMGEFPSACSVDLGETREHTGEQQRPASASHEGGDGEDLGRGGRLNFIISLGPGRGCSRPEWNSSTYLLSMKLVLL
jgi:hypothetical protein